MRRDLHMSAINGDGREAVWLAQSEGAANKKLGGLIEKLNDLSKALCGAHFDEGQRATAMESFLQDCSNQMLMLLEKNVKYANLLNR
jgi:hypothetical protein